MWRPPGSLTDLELTSFLRLLKFFMMMKIRLFAARSATGFLLLSAILIFPVSVSWANEVHLANGIKIGEMDTRSAIVWMRLTQQAERNIDGIAFENLKPENQPAYPDLSIMAGSVTGQAGEVMVKYWPEGRPDEASVTDWVGVDAATDFIHQFHLTELQPGTAYQVVARGRTDDDRIRLRGSFRTAPEASQAADVSFVVTTCGDYPRRDDADNGHVIYKTMLGLDPDFLVHTGDAEYYDYGGPQAVTPALARFKWNRLYSMPYLRTFHNQVGCYFIKDDHDTMKDDCWPGDTFGEITWEQGVAIHKEQVPMGKTPYRTVRWGKHLQIWLVEGREFRTPNTMKDGPEKTIWGKKQKQWFFDTVTASDATHKILLSATPVVGPDRISKKDNHANASFATEGNEIRDFIRKQGNMYIVCGDRHWQYASVDPRTGVREFSCGPATDKHAGGYKQEDADPERHKFLLVKGGFLQVSVDAEAGGLVFQHHAVDGTVRHRETFAAPPK